MVRLTLVGDIFPANLSYNRNCGVASLNFDGSQRLEYVRKIKEIVGVDCLFVGNLESPILSESQFSKELAFVGHPNFIKVLKEAGVSLLSIANNHILEHKHEGLVSTERILRDEGVKYVGTCDEDGHPKVEVIERNGMRLAFIAYNAIDNQKYEQGYISVYDLSRVKNDVIQLRRQNIDDIFVILHWGDEYIHRPSPVQIEEARALIDLGARFVICSHPHVVQPVEEYHGGLICYSLGNFVFDMTTPKSVKTGMIVKLELMNEGFRHHEDFIRLQKDFFPAILEDDHAVRLMLDSQKRMMKQWRTKQYAKMYVKEKNRKRLEKRVAEKYLLFKNWHKYTPTIRREFLHYYMDIFRHGKN